MKNQLFAVNSGLSQNSIVAAILTSEVTSTWNVLKQCICLCVLGVGQEPVQCWSEWAASGQTQWTKTEET